MKGLRNPVIKYKGKNYYIGCNYRTKWQKSKDAHWLLADIDEKTGVCTLTPKQKKEKDICVIKTDVSDLVYIDNINNIRKRGYISQCKTGEYLMVLTNRKVAEKFYGQSVNVKNSLEDYEM